MIPDERTNFLYLADTLPSKYDRFFSRFEKVLADCGIGFSLLPHTRDVWAVDYMPVQIDRDQFVQFIYRPDYLQDTRRVKWSQTITDVDAVCKAIGLQPEKSNIILDGGNVTRTAGKVIMCDKIFKENPAFCEKDLIRVLEEILQVEQLTFIPTHPLDFTGHADGMVRFYDRDTVLINDYSREDREFQLRFRMALHNAGLKYIEIPYNPYRNKKNEHANGEYINYLHMQQAIILPVFGIPEDDAVVKQFEQLFPGKRIATIDANDLAYNGGILNCITWNIYK